MAEDNSTMWAQDEYHFHGQRPDEHVLLIRNQHVIVLTPIILIALVSFVLLWLIVRFFDGSLQLWGVIFYLIFLGSYLAHHIYSYLNSISIISSQRIVSVDQKGFFNRKISEAELSRIRDVSTNIKGVLQTAFGFGDVTIRTASETVLTLKNIIDPYSTQQAIVRALKK